MRLAECATIGSDESEFWMVAHALDVIDLSRHEATTRLAASRIYSKEGVPKFPPILVIAALACGGPGRTADGRPAALLASNPLTFPSLGSRELARKTNARLPLRNPRKPMLD